MLGWVSFAVTLFEKLLMGTRRQVYTLAVLPVGTKPAVVLTAAECVWSLQKLPVRALRCMGLNPYAAARCAVINFLR